MKVVERQVFGRDLDQLPCSNWAITCRLEKPLGRHSHTPPGDSRLIEDAGSVKDSLGSIVSAICERHAAGFVRENGVWAPHGIIVAA
jgi:hypothetical protein